MQKESTAGEILFKAIFTFIAKVLITMWTWNYLMPTFGLHELSFGQAFAVAILGECIFQPWNIAVTTKK